ncbi:MAG TPA: type III pantothenate kinase [Steroidobacteraceae bacterium]|nr:type III pantothenate kinase [Steroidobacteraceae bacterium]
MSILLVDIGNTRAKWAVLRGARLSKGRALPHRAGDAGLAALVRNAPRDVSRVIAVCVAGARRERALAAAVRARFGLRAEFIRPARSAAGVRNGYREVWRLGADRWVAAIGAHHLAGARDALVVSIGTALTVDAVDGEGHHRGGAIVPGPRTMVDSLLSGTSGIRRRARGAHARGGSSRKLFAADTASALEAGAAFAAAAFVDRAVLEAGRVFGRRPLVLLTGGAARALAPYIKSAVKAVPDLVLRGLAVLARA